MVKYRSPARLHSFALQQVMKPIGWILIKDPHEKDSRQPNDNQRYARGESDP
jgi:hypothetical protein